MKFRVGNPIWVPPGICPIDNDLIESMEIGDDDYVSQVNFNYDIILISCLNFRIIYPIV